MTSISEHIRKYKSVYIKGSIAIASIGILSYGIWWTNIRKDAFELFVNDASFAQVKTQEEAVSALESIVEDIEKKLGKDVILLDEVAITPVNSKKEKLVDEETLKEKLAPEINYQIQAIEVVVDGEPRAIVENEQVGYEVLKEIVKTQAIEDEEISLKAEEVPGVSAARHHIMEKEEDKQVLEVASGMPQQTKTLRIHVDKAQSPVVAQKLSAESSVQKDLLAFDFNKEVILRSVYTDEDKLQSKEETIDILLSNTDEVVTYEMQAGDNIWDIAISHGTTMDRILEINPQIQDERRMQIGEVIKVEAPDPILAIATTEEATFKELIEAEIEYIEDSTLYKGEEKVKQEGNDGVKEIKVLVHRVNGKEVDRTHLSERILTEPTKKVIAYGTKEKPKTTAKPAVKPSSSTRFMHPLNGKGRISSPYGSRWGSFHRGIDIAAPYGTPIYAAASGTVIYSGYNNGGFGNLVMIDHGNGYQTYYAHNSKNHVRVGQKVIKGQNIANVGSTGNSTGNHVHFEVRRNGTPINPYSFIY